MLLKCYDAGKRMVVDPLLNVDSDSVGAPKYYPAWTRARYDEHGIMTSTVRGEDLDVVWAGTYDEAWIYNCLQHVDDPALIIRNALAISRRLRLFEWINIPPHAGHPQMLTKAKLDEWLSATPGVWGGGEVHHLNYEGCFGEAYVAVVQGGAK